MPGSNQTPPRIEEFIIIGFPGFRDTDSQTTIFGSLLAIYICILLGNLLIVIIFLHDKNLHSPMYILITNLALTDILVSSATVPKLLSILRSGSGVISFAACFLQMFSYYSMTNVESFLLVLMAYDRYLAICNPLHYFTLTSNSLVLRQIGWCWACAFLIVIVPLSPSVALAFCGSNIVNHFFCDHSALLKLACSDTTINNYAGLCLVICILIFPLLCILFSYTKVIISVLRISSNDGRLKAFSTCSTQLTVIAIFFLVASGVYISNRVPNTSADVRIFAALIQTILPPLMNPIIYCIRNAEIRESFSKMLKKI
ncbi:olfactory receptor 1E5-like [Erpetoichthys calabaricus]|uniref:olfactory receptor 1E5-like n=1 Tax=Erpetoichthys calabaricus TaxID=27687 RepID=UPI002233F3D5|nr:olfactory receptor 1E5-like [Erpetoichthys calabaricus]